MNKKQKVSILQISLCCFLLILAICCCINPKTLNLATFFFISAYMIIGADVFYKTIINIFKLNFFDENFLMFMATSCAFFLKEYFEAVVVLLLYKIGELFQNIAVNHSKNSVATLMKIKPQFANLKINNKITKIYPEKIKIGDVIVVKPGEKVPIDGTVIFGNSLLNTSALTGESKPTIVSPGDKIVSGSININQTIEIRAEKQFCDCTIQKILNLIENAKNKKTKSEKFITKFAKIYTPIVACSAVMVALIPPLVFAQNLNVWLNMAIVFLAISCPCALVISIPLSFFGSLANSAKNSILIKGNNIIEKLPKIRTIFFDKTGTLTLGKFEINKIESKTMKKNELLKLLATAESLTNHHIATAIKLNYSSSIDSSKIEKFEEFAGLGVVATTKEYVIYAGNSKLMDKFKIEHENVQTSDTVIYIAKNNCYIGYVTISDKIRPNAKKTIENLRRKHNIKNFIMLTGDEQTAANEVAKTLKISKNFSKLLPHEKVQKIENFQQKEPVIFIGDGINDAPALCAADIGIAMGKNGTDAATESADIILVDDNLNNIAKIFSIAKKTMKIVKQNIALSIGIKFLILTTSFFWPLNIWLAIFADVGTSTLTVLNALRTLKQT